MPHSGDETENSSGSSLGSQEMDDSVHSIEKTQTDDDILLRKGVLMFCVSGDYKLNFSKDKLLKEWARDMINAKGYDIERRDGGEPTFHAVKISEKKVAEYIDEDDLESNKDHMTADETKGDRTQWRMFMRMMNELYPVFPCASLEGFLVGKVVCEYDIGLHCELAKSNKAWHQLEFQMTARLLPPRKEGEQRTPQPVATWGGLWTEDERQNRRMQKINKEFRLNDVVEYMKHFVDEENHGFRHRVDDAGDDGDGESEDEPSEEGDTGKDGGEGEDCVDREPPALRTVGSRPQPARAPTALPQRLPGFPPQPKALSSPPQRPAFWTEPKSPPSSPPQVPAAAPSTADVVIHPKLAEIYRHTEFLRTMIVSVDAKVVKIEANLEKEREDRKTLGTSLREKSNRNQTRTKAYKQIEESFSRAEAEIKRMELEKAELTATVKALRDELAQQPALQLAVEMQIHADAVKKDSEAKARDFEEKAKTAEMRAARAEDRRDEATKQFAGFIVTREFLNSQRLVFKLRKLSVLGACAVTEQRQQGGVARIANSAHLPQLSAPASVPPSNLGLRSPSVHESQQGVETAEKGGAGTPAVNRVLAYVQQPEDVEEAQSAEKGGVAELSTDGGGAKGVGGRPTEGPAAAPPVSAPAASAPGANPGDPLVDCLGPSTTKSGPEAGRATARDDPFEGEGMEAIVDNGGTGGAAFPEVIQRWSQVAEAKKATELTGDGGKKGLSLAPAPNTSKAIPHKRHLPGDVTDAKRQRNDQFTVSRTDERKVVLTVPAPLPPPASGPCVDKGTRVIVARPGPSFPNRGPETGEAAAGFASLEGERKKETVDKRGGVLGTRLSAPTSKGPPAIVVRLNSATKNCPRPEKASAVHEPLEGGGRKDVLAASGPSICQAAAPRGVSVHTSSQSKKDLGRGDKRTKETEM